MSYIRSTLRAADAACQEAVGMAGFRVEDGRRTYVATARACPLCATLLKRPTPQPTGRIVQAPPGARIGEEIVVDLLPEDYDALVCARCRVWFYVPPVA